MENNATTSLQLEAMALAIPDVPKHPNRVPFAGVLTVLDSPSDRAPAGAAGHRVLMPRHVAEAALPSLLGMAVDYAPGLRGHDVRRKIGVITRAEIADDRLEVSGYLYGKDFPEILRELRARRERLGMSYEVTSVRVKDTAADVWELENVVFTGAAILERSAAAYEATSLAAQRSLAFPEIKEGEIMEMQINAKLESLAGEFVALRSSVERVAQILERGITAQGAPVGLETRVEELARVSQELRRQNEALRAQAEAFSTQITRKTISPQVMTLLAKSGVSGNILGTNGQLDLPMLDKALQGVPVEKRIAIKSLLARSGEMS